MFCLNKSSVNAVKLTYFSKCGLYSWKLTTLTLRQLSALSSAFFTSLRDLIGWSTPNSCKPCSATSNHSKSTVCQVSRCLDTNVKQSTKTHSNQKLVLKGSKVNLSIKKIDRRTSREREEPKCKRK